MAATSDFAVDGDDPGSEKTVERRAARLQAGAELLEAVLETMATAKVDGMPFERAWRHACARLPRGQVGREWRQALQATESGWRCAYLGEEDVAARTLGPTARARAL